MATVRIAGEVGLFIAKLRSVLGVEYASRREDFQEADGTLTRTNGFMLVNWAARGLSAWVDWPDLGELAYRGSNVRELAMAKEGDLFFVDFRQRAQFQATIVHVGVLARGKNGLTVIHACHQAGRVVEEGYYPFFRRFQAVRIQRIIFS